MIRVRLALAAALALGAAAVPAHAADPVESVLHEQTGTGPVWHAVPVATDGADVSVEIALRGVKDPAGVMIAVFRHGTPLHSSTFLRSPSSTDALVSVDAGPGTITVERLEYGNDSGDFGARTTMRDAPADVYGFVAFAAGAVVEWDLTVSGEPGAAIAGTLAQGTRTFLRHARDFRGTANLSLFALGTGARVNGATTAVLGAEHGLVARFFHPFTNENAMTARTPGGREVECSCTLWGDDGPGDYTFSLTGAGAGTNAFASTALIAADAAIPD